jgi:cellulose synthase/poly-beta-1,6-N-acetylglucosamine synthase-like glycosyltransferase
MRSTLIFIFGAITVLAAVLIPAVHLATTLVNFVVNLAVMGMQLVVSRFAARTRPTTEPLGEEPFVSIHIPTHNEPPEVVFQTLRSLSQLKWSNYEVLVIDNNTSDPELWRPVEEYCRVLGRKFRFFHVEGLAGFKAGAMNYVRQFMDPRASFIFVVDADYVVDRNALRTGLRYFTDERIGLIQFPQDYRNISAANRGIALDYKHFFSGFMNVANAMRCVPSTGTLALINVKALQNIGGFDSQFITEDAELGLKLALEGYKSIYVNRVIGAGLIPHELDGLKKQRWRWAFGNAQILRKQWREIAFSPALNWKQRLGFISHLTAWINFNLIPSISLIVLALYALLSSHTVEHVYTAIFSGLTLVTYLILKYGVLHYSLRRDGYSLADVWRAFGSHLALGWIFSASWMRCLVNSSSPFIRTNKFLSAAVPGILRTILIELSLGVSLMGASLILAFADFIIAPLAALAMCGARFAILWVWAQTKHTFVTTGSLFPRIEPASIPLKEAALEPV